MSANRRRPHNRTAEHFARAAWWAAN